MAVLRLDHNTCSSDFMLHLFLVYSGDYCEVNLCHNEGTCVTGVGDDPFICICADGFAGDTCNLTETGDEKSSFLDYKYKQLCQNIKQTSFFSVILPGPCSPNPCKNDGVCEVIAASRRGDVFNGYVCKCQPGFEGVLCQTSKLLLAVNFSLIIALCVNL